MSTRIAVLVSGSGSNLQALIDAKTRGDIDGDIVGVLSNKPGVFALQRAADAGLDTAVVAHGDYSGREAFDAAMHEQLLAWDCDLIVLAGFMRILSAGFVQNWAGRMLNIHPSLLPKYRGTQTHQRAIDAGDSHHGCSVHFVTEELDGGPLVVQSSLNIQQGDTADSLAERVQTLEHKVYPEVVGWFCNGKLQWHKGVISFESAPLVAPLQHS